MLDLHVVARAPRLVDVLSRPSPIVAPENLIDSARGAMTGLAVGNLLGLPIEFCEHNDIIARYPNGVRDINPTEARKPMDDDLAQAVELAESLLSGGDYVQDFAERLITWARTNGRGMGYTTCEVIKELERGAPLPEPARVVYERKGRIAPNGGVMRCAPVAIARRLNPELLVSDSAQTCAVTHYAATCQWSCIIVNAIIAQLLNGVEPDLSAIIAASAGDGCPDLTDIARRDGIPMDTLEAVASGRQPPPDMSWMLGNQKLIGHTLIALQFGLWAAATPHGFEEALVASVSVGGDTDTNAAVAGAVLGARYGLSAIPKRWLECIPERDRIIALADGLAALDRN